MSAPGLDAVIAAAARFLPGGIVEPVGDRSWLVSVTTEASRFSVRQFDPTVPAVRVDLIHEFLSAPDVRHTTPLVAHDRVGAHAFDARGWADGNPIGSAIVFPEWATLPLPTVVEIDQLGTIAAALGTFHASGSNGSILARAPHPKLKDTLPAVRRSLDFAERQLAGEIRKESRARRWLSAARPLLTNAEQALEQASYLRDEPLVLGHQNLSGCHIVLVPDHAATFLDCSGLASVPAVSDIAQLVARNGSWSDERVERVLQRYTEATPLPPLQRRVLPWLAALDAIASCGQLLVAAHSERRPLSDNDRRAAFASADLQIVQLETLARAFVPPPPRQYRRPGRRG